jgi:hypothetical protein
MEVGADQEQQHVTHEEGCGRGDRMGGRVGSDGGREGRRSWLLKRGEGGHIG